MSNETDHTDPAALVAGCADPEVARTRAHQVIDDHAPATDDAERYWNAHAERVFAALLHAAALNGDRTDYGLAAWLIDPDLAHDEIEATLERVEQQQMFWDASQFMATNPRTRKSLCMTILYAQTRATLAVRGMDA